MESKLTVKVNKACACTYIPYINKRKCQKITSKLEITRLAKHIQTPTHNSLEIITDTPTNEMYISQ